MRRQYRLRALPIAVFFLILCPTSPAGNLTNSLPDFRLKLLDGRVVRSADLKGKVAVVDFWGTWCKPCLQEIPAYNAFFQEYKDRGVFLVGLAVDSGSEGDVMQAVKRLGIQYPIAAPSLKELDVWGDIPVFPATLVFGRSGRVEKELLGSFNAKQQTLRETVDKLLKR
jgi:cytochrome c biogenesis protein CcmG/thiol:disulfide interchange protein DsbE